MVALNEALKTVRIMVDLLQPYTQQIEIAGSIRRGNKPDVKDAEIVAIPNPGLLAFTDSLIGNGVEKALYGETKTTRWGEKYRGMLYQGIKVELFLTTADSWGFQFWLRTGPGDANTYVMKWLKWKQAPIRAQEGAWWCGNRRLAILTESDQFTLLGLPFIAPKDRTEALYKKLLNAPEHKWPDFSRFYAPDPEPPPMFQFEAVVKDEDFAPASDKDKRIEAERKYNTRLMAAHNALFERAARGEWLDAWEARIVANRADMVKERAA